MFEEKMNPGSLYLMLMCGWGEWLGIQLYWNRPGVGWLTRQLKDFCDFIFPKHILGHTVTFSKPSMYRES